jgi:hypothetical protein
MRTHEPIGWGRTLGAALSAAVLLYVVAGRPWLRTWGTSHREATKPLPGDELVPGRWQTTRAVVINAPAAQVWPWLIQMGYERGGWYSYDWLERRGGAGTFTEGESAKRVIPQLQSLAVGDTIALSPAGGPRVAVLRPDSALVLQYRMNLLTSAEATPDDRAVMDWSWAFILVPTGATSCRLLARVRADYRPHWLFVLFPALLEPVHFLMETKMLRTIDQRASR